jgi:4-hydroxy-tetrahydrodipicolinate reductase
VFGLEGVVMKIAIVGYGKMGHMIERAALARGHEVVCTVDVSASDAKVITNDPATMAEAVKKSGAQAAIEFSHPSSVLANIGALVATRIPLVVGTTGWYDSLGTVRKQVEQSTSTLMYSANFSVGVNLFYRIVSDAAKRMAEFEEYDVAVLESHHNQKADSPSGTGLEIAKRILEDIPRKTKVVTDAFDRKPAGDELHLASVRVGSVPGTHTVFFDSAADTIELTHTARNREGLALGAVRASEWLVTAGPGVFTMNDLFDSL